MHPTCRAPGCQAPISSRFSIFCSRHQSRLRRQGDVAQEAITKADLKTYVGQVRNRIAKNPDNPAWASLDDRWRTVVGHAEGILAAARRGVAGASYQRTAAHEVVKLNGHVKPREIVEAALALFMLLQDQPRRFRSDQAFRTQLVRRTRGLSDVNAGTRFDAVSGRTRRAYRELTPRATAVLGQWLADAFGAAGLHLAKLEEGDREARQREAQQLREALRELT
jgi:hypothetical protein